jgi:hypothetical protein
MSLCWKEYVCPTDGWLAAAHSDLRGLVLDCMTTLGLSTCAALCYAPKTARLALKYHGLALSRLHVALASHAGDDRTLLAIMILTHVHTAIHDDRQALPGWTAHIDGCVEILHIRGYSRLRAEEDQQLFFQAALNVVSYCFRSAKKVPTRLQGLTISLRENIRPTSPCLILWHLLAARTLVANQYSDHFHGKVVDQPAAIEQAMNAERELSRLLKHAIWHRTPSEHGSSIEEYLMMAGRAAVLFARLLLHLLVQATGAESANIKILDQLESSRRTCLALRQELFATISCQAELVKDEVRRTSSGYMLLLAQIGVTNAAFARADETMVRNLAGAAFNVVDKPQLPQHRLSRGYNIIWALFLIGGLEEPHSIQRQRAVSLLQDIGKTLAIDQAMELARRLEVDSNS